MADNMYGLTTNHYKLDQLVTSLLEKKEEEIELLNRIHDEKKQAKNAQNRNTELELRIMQGEIANLTASITKLAQDCANNFQMISVLTEKVQQILDANEKTHRMNYALYEEINQARLKVIKTQQNILRALKFIMPITWLKSFLHPRLGSLYHYDPKPFFKIPARYKKTIHLAKPPTISIVTPSYNQGHFLERTILSVLNQHYPALEYIVQDGGSKDETTTVLDRYKSSLKHAASAPDKGQSNALNLGFQHATGDIMAYLNSDDVLLTGTLHYVANYFDEHPEVDVVYGHRVIVDENDNEIGRWVLPPHNDEVLTWADFVPQETLFWRRSIWEKAGGCIDESFRFAMDWDLLLRFKAAGAKFARLPRFLGAFRVHTQQKTSREIADVGAKEMDRLRTRCHGRHVTYHEVRKNLRSYQIKHVLYHRLYKLGMLRY